MKQILSIILFGCLTTLPFTSCMGDEDDPNTDGYIITSTTSIGKVNSTIGEVKNKYCASTEANFYTKVTEDVIIEGVVAANDEGGNLYQTLLLRNIDVYGNDQSIVLAIKNPFLSPFFPLGQRVKVNLKGLYAGCYGCVPKIGQPYRTSQENFRLGPILLELCRTNIELVGLPDPNAPELQPVDLTAGITINQDHKDTPVLATVEGVIDEVQGGEKNNAEEGELSGAVERLPKIFAPEVLRDKGFAVNRHMTMTNGKKLILRTSTQNSIAFLPIPEDSRKYTGVLTHYRDDWQMQLRSVKDIVPEVVYP